MDTTSTGRVVQQRPLMSPATLCDEVPPSAALTASIARWRQQLAASLMGRDRRLVAVVGPCSIHDPRAALEYAGRLAALQPQVGDALHLVMRTYFEKPRSTVGWKGLLNDPHLDRSFAVDDGLRLARRLLCDIGALGVPTACEFLDLMTPTYLADVICWGAIGARTAESQVHRALASGLGMPVGFKNGTDGRLDVAIDGVKAAAAPHSYLGIDTLGQAALISTRGNRDCHIILRGGKRGPNYDAGALAVALRQLVAADLPPRLMIDFSHGNSGKDLRRQQAVADDVGAQLAAGQPAIRGIMMESFLQAGAQILGDPQALRYGQSITDPCLGWEDTATTLLALARSVRQGARAEALTAACSLPTF